MEEWKEYKLGDIISIKSGYAYKGKMIGYGENVLLGMGCVSFKEKFLLSGARAYAGDCADRYCAQKGDIVLATRQQSDNLPILGMPAIVPNNLDNKKIIIGANLYRVENYSDFSNAYIYWLLKTPLYINHIRSCQTGTTVRMITKSNIENFRFKAPDKKGREAIISFLKSLDDKIENNKRINENLEQQAQALFKSWFMDFEPFRDQPFVESELGMIPQGWDIVSLSSIADYINGLAMQKFRPLENEKGLPVLKIKELGNGDFDSNAEFCSPSLVDDKFIIDNGDIIFSWSGTLMVKYWCGGKGGLNQHLFNVVPKDYPKWFVYQWTKFHLANFIRIAKDKAVTMGHIKRGELDKAKVVVPDKVPFERINAKMCPIHEQIILNEVESRHLSKLRDTLLPKLMSGEIKV